MNNSQEKLATIRQSMKDRGIDVYIIPHADPHIGENIPDHWRIIEWLTGFTGSAGIIIITDSLAGLWTDSRYFIQAENQLINSGFVFMKPSGKDKTEYIDWLGQNLNKSNRIGLDGRIFSIRDLKKIESITKGKGISIDIECELISAIWTDRPSLPGIAVIDHPIAFCGKERGIKIIEVREEMKRLNVDYHLLSAPDDIMWLLNIRGGDTKYSPLLMSFAIIGGEQTLFFADEEKISPKLAREFDYLRIVILPYEEITSMLSVLSARSSLLISPGSTSAALYHSVRKGIKIKEAVSIPAQLKAIKNKVEIENIERAMIKDGIAMTKFFFWIENSSETMSELSLTEKLLSFRSEQEYFLGPSFAFIVAYNEHGALPHYSADSETDTIILQKGILLVDSGSQYLNGTTDITRTIALGRPSEKQKKDFTLVLKGTINLAIAKFPSGTNGYQLDILARKALWEEGQNYSHGTGHGVGYCLNVHEGPYSISPVVGIDSKFFFRPGILISDEPAIYRKGEYGIRIENLLLCYEDEETEFGQFLKFDTVSLCYIDKSLTDSLLLEVKELEWLNNYHSVVYEKISPFLTIEENEWLREKTNPIRT